VLCTKCMCCTAAAVLTCSTMKGSRCELQCDLLCIANQHNAGVVRCCCCCCLVAHLLLCMTHMLLAAAPHTLQRSRCFQPCTALLESHC
jgi:hypothetical protein